MKQLFNTWKDAATHAKSDEIFLSIVFVMITIITALDMTGILPLIDIVTGLASWI